MSRRRYRLAQEPTQQLYRDLIGLVSAKSDRATLVLRKTLGANERCIGFLRSVERDLIEITDQGARPGTELIDSTEPVHSYRVTPGFIAAIRQAVHRLFGWIQPDRPEDPAFYRRDSSIVLVTIAHERLAFVEMSEVEIHEFRRKLPAIRFESD